MVAVSRRSFLVTAGTGVVAGACAAEEKIFDGGLVDVLAPGVPTREGVLVPPGATGMDAFARRCVGCQLCVRSCPNHVMRPSTAARRLLLPEMVFDQGWCRPECVKCGEVCPTGAIRKLVPEQKKQIHVGRAVWQKDRCLAATEGVTCTACQRHCPQGAIVLMPLQPDEKASPKVPVVDAAKCIGCGSCEHLCPARPLPALVVQGYEYHREVTPMSEADVLAEARRLIERNEAAVVLVKRGIICAAQKGRGVVPLLDLMDHRPADVSGAWVVDKVVGRAAAAIAVQAGAARVHGLLMSQEAETFLKEKGIPCSADALVPRILNRTQDGLCPLEAAVEGLNEPKDMLKAIRKRMRELRGQRKTS